MAKLMYMCCACDELHEFESMAEECCRPEVETVYVCDVCGEAHDTAKDADACCIGDGAVCKTCFRGYDGRDINAHAIMVTGHCSVCSPHFTFDEQFRIEDLHTEKTGKRERLNA